MKMYQVCMLVKIGLIAASIVVGAEEPGAQSAVVSANGAIVFSADKAIYRGLFRRVDGALSVPPESKAWNGKWKIGGTLPVGKYKVRAYVRVIKPMDGYGIRFGIYSPQGRDMWINTILPVVGMPSGTYHWLDLGIADIKTNDPDAYLFVASGGDNSFYSFLVKQVEFSPLLDGEAGLAKVATSSGETFVETAISATPKDGVISFTAATADYRGGFRKVDGAMSVPASSKAWDGKWKIGKKLPVGRYEVRSYVKVTGPRAGFGIRFGIYSPQGRDMWLNTTLPVAGMPSGTYQWLDLGIADIKTNDPDAYLFVASGGDNSFDSLLVKSVEFNIIE